jgi:hypothetical protein
MDESHSAAFLGKDAVHGWKSCVYTIMFGNINVAKQAAAKQKRHILGCVVALFLRVTLSQL